MCIMENGVGVEREKELIFVIWDGAVCSLSLTPCGIADARKEGRARG